MPSKPAETAPTSDLMIPEVCSLMAAEIAQAGDREVFFIAQTATQEDGTLLLTSAEAVARGDDSSVPAIMHLCRYGDVVIHNHPSGDLEPSQADIGIASSLGSMGVGFLIIDNAATRAYVVVKPFKIPEIVPLDIEEIADRLSPQGDLAQALEDYEPRESQVQMLTEVVGALNEHRIALIEAGTGTGKSLAYLLPALRWAKQNKQRIVVSTNTINLQEQLIHKDLPFLREHFGEEFHAVLVKGRSNYLCRRKLAEALKDKRDEAFERPESNDQLREIAEWAERTEDGSTSDLSFVPNGEVWERVQSHADTTLRVRCPHYDQCFFYRARREASRADLLVVNHSLLMSDVAIRRSTENWSGPAVLPPYQQIIIDEAHNLEQAATGHFTRVASRAGIRRVLGRLIRSRRRQSGVIPEVWNRVVDIMTEDNDPLLKRLADDLETTLKEQRFTLQEQTEQLFDQMEEAFTKHVGGEPRLGQEITLRLVPEIVDGPLWIERLHPAIQELARDLEEYAERLRGFFRTADKLSERATMRMVGPMLELRSLLNQMTEIASNLRFLAQGLTEDHCHWISLYHGRNHQRHLKLVAAPLSVANALRSALFEKFPSLTLTSATLAIKEDFTFLKRGIGLEGIGEKRLSELVLQAPFDYEHQALVAVGSDMPDPNARTAPDELAKVIAPAVLASRGRAFVLFTSHRMLSDVHRRLAPLLTDAGLRVLRQGDTNRLTLIREFQSDPAAVLFATASFWEGVDMRGDQLVNLILTKLPFQQLNDPLLEARGERLHREGRSPFNELQLPHAILKFKQGFGRLIRHRDDRGCVLLLDPRLVTKGYGQQFLRALPTESIHVWDSERMLTEVRSFFARE